MPRVRGSRGAVPAAAGEAKRRRVDAATPAAAAAAAAPAAASGAAAAGAPPAVSQGAVPSPEARRPKSLSVDQATASAPPAVVLSPTQSPSSSLGRFERDWIERGAEPGMPDFSDEWCDVRQEGDDDGVDSEGQLGEGEVLADEGMIQVSQLAQGGSSSVMDDPEFGF
eukprot:TRINITY_DN19482_c0_g1_i1.p1 TRINITY_DN19482_c0_g1~~TRINITY_DN19482_c0_g1_i1.p1  ORF type:complete len:197 (+),score=51.35 TRINITY_DN19482_c0_g1_i1:88-591(+)